MVGLPMAQSLGGDLDHPNRFEKTVWTSYGFITVLNLVFTIVCEFVDENEIELDQSH